MNEPIDLLQSHFGLAPAEARLALHLVAGETFRSAAVKLSISCVRRQRSLDRTGGLKKGEFLAHRNVHRSEDETANSTIEGFG